MKKITKKATRLFVKNKLSINEQWMLKGLLKIYEYQTVSEKTIGETYFSNGVGFSGFDDPNLGYLWYSDQKKVKVIYINPLRCTNLKKNNLYGYPKDNSICSTISHEFGHFLDLKLKLLEPYNTEEFTNKKLILTKYAREDLKEELAESVVHLYIIPFRICHLSNTYS